MRDDLTTWIASTVKSASPMAFKCVVSFSLLGKLSDRFIPNRYLPYGALTEVGSYAT